MNFFRFHTVVKTLFFHFSVHFFLNIFCFLWRKEVKDQLIPLITCTRINFFLEDWWLSPGQHYFFLFSYSQLASLDLFSNKSVVYMKKGWFSDSRSGRSRTGGVSSAGSSGRIHARRGSGEGSPSPESKGCKVPVLSWGMVWFTDLCRFQFHKLFFYFSRNSWNIAVPH